MDPKGENKEAISVKKSPPIIVQSETKHDNEFFFLSNIDQEFLVMVETVYFFKPEEHESSKNVNIVIKEALAKVLVHFYPFTGRLMEDENSGKFIVKCTNDGVPFVEAEADCDIDTIGDITTPDPVVLRKFVHTVPDAEDLLQMPLLSVQVTKFKCGGFILGLVINHIMVDGKSAMEFIKSWAETARGVPLTTGLPYLDRRVLAARQPPLVQYPNETYVDIDDVSDILSLYTNEEMVNESFYFDLEMITRLKNIATEDGVVSRCTSFTVLTGLVWRERCKALKMRPDQKTRLLVIVDARSRLETPLPKGYFGNAVMKTCCISTAGELMEKPLSFVVKMVQDAIYRVNDDYIKSSIDYVELNKPKNSFIETLIVNSWTTLSFNMADFGWGQPVQSGCATLPEIMDSFFLSGGKGGQKKGVTYLLGLPCSAMKSFKELMQF